jgi:hypothetical protein
MAGQFPPFENPGPGRPVLVAGAGSMLAPATNNSGRRPDCSAEDACAGSIADPLIGEKPPTTR